MRDLQNRIRWMPNYIRAFGAIRGTVLLAQTRFRTSRRPDKLRKLQVPGLPTPVFVRDTVADHAIFRQCLVKEQYDFRTFPHAERLMQAYEAATRAGKPPLIIDCGGNIGLATLWFSRVFPQARFAILEPEDRNFELLSRNTASLEGRIHRIKGAIWNRPAKLSITNPQAGSAAFRVEEQPVSSRDGIRGYTIDEVCEMCDVEHPFIVKLDIEGSQAALFRDNTRWVENVHLITLELDDWLMPWEGTSRNFFRCVSQLPFEYLFREESIFCFRDFEGR